MEWTSEFRDEMKQRQLARLQYSLIAILFLSFFLILSLGFIRISKGDIVGHYIVIIILCFALIPTPFIFLFKYLLRYNSLVRPIALIILFMDIIYGPFVVYAFGMQSTISILLLPLVVVLYSVYIDSSFATRLFFGNQVVFLSLGLLAYNRIIPYAPAFKTDVRFYNEACLPFLDHLTPYNLFFVHFTIFMFVGVTLIATNLVVNKMKQREKELDVTNKKISVLSNKLKVFLPQQFVKTLENGEADSAPDYERRKLTVFFSDVKGFTVWTDKLEPEDTREFLNQYLSEMSKIAFRWGGTIDKFIGDAIMIFFGAPEFTSDKDHAVRCVKMAMEMQEKMKELRMEWEDLGYDEPLHIRIGINTGYATVGTFGSEDRLNYTILGSSVNLAARLEAACQPDRITVGHATYSLIKNEIECESKGTIEVKGFSEPIKIYEIKGIKT
jgi:class 3 adenylate cyclase